MMSHRHLTVSLKPRPRQCDLCSGLDVRVARLGQDAARETEETEQHRRVTALILPIGCPALPPSPSATTASAIRSVVAANGGVGIPPNDTDDAAPSPDTLDTTRVMDAHRNDPFVYQRPVDAADNVIVPVFDVAVGVNVPDASAAPPPAGCEYSSRAPLYSLLSIRDPG